MAGRPRGRVAAAAAVPPFDPVVMRAGDAVRAFLLEPEGGARQVALGALACVVPGPEQILRLGVAHVGGAPQPLRRLSRIGGPPRRPLPVYHAEQVHCLQILALRSAREPPNGLAGVNPQAAGAVRVGDAQQAQRRAISVPRRLSEPLQSLGAILRQAAGAHLAQHAQVRHGIHVTHVCSTPVEGRGLVHIAAHAIAAHAPAEFLGQRRESIGIAGGGRRLVPRCVVGEARLDAIFNPEDDAIPAARKYSHAMGQVVLMYRQVPAPEIDKLPLLPRTIRVWLHVQSTVELTNVQAQHRCAKGVAVQVRRMNPTLIGQVPPDQHGTYDCIWCVILLAHIWQQPLLHDRPQHPLEIRMQVLPDLHHITLVGGPLVDAVVVDVELQRHLCNLQNRRHLCFRGQRSQNEEPPRAVLDAGFGESGLVLLASPRGQLE
mmetsp:Transcript_2682/g.10441  ORF Transcript_2682/g.10441 Transcript_2682/m.10441 type:complete len:432 (-) Transcript_2682:789-2084(-)